MTALQLYNFVLVELNKVEAPNILLEDFNYFANKAVNNYINKRYNIYDVNQQTTDDLRVLKATAILDVKKPKRYGNDFNFMDATYEVELPSDYLHILNCVCLYKVVNDPIGCYDRSGYLPFAAKRLTADSWSEVLDNYWNRPTYKRPYYYIHNVNISADVPTNPYREDDNYNTNLSFVGTDSPSNFTQIISIKKKDNDSSLKKYKVTNGFLYLISTEESKNPSYVLLNNKIYNTNGTELSKDYEVTIELKEEKDSKFDPESINISKSLSLRKKEANIRYGNRSKVLMEIRYGADNTNFLLEKVAVDYLKTPQHILLTQTQVDKTTDTSQILEFPDYVCQEILNELVMIILEHNSDPRLQTEPVVSLSIANPVQQLTQPTAKAVQQSS